MKKLLSTLFCVLALSASGLMAQTTAPATSPTATAASQPAAPKPEAKLVYFEDETQINVTDDQGKNIPAQLGLSLLPGYTIKTLKSVAEIKLIPNGSIIKMVPSTIFKIEGLQGLDRAPSNDFALLQGKIRTVAAKLAGAPALYSIRTPTAVAGIRGTDFALLAQPGAKDWICVQEGAVEYLNSTTGESLMVKTGEFADIFANTFKALPAPPEQLQQIFSDLNFKALKIDEVPGHTVQPVAAETKPASEPTAPTTPVTEPVAETKPADESKKDAPAPSSNNDFMKMLSKLLGFEIGAVTIDGKTYSKAIVQPNINLDNFKLGLYLPIIYSKDIFDPATYYKPSGNNEWSFGSDTSFGNDWIARGLDFLSDVALKIKYVEIGRQDFDPFFMKVGSLKTMTIGHGSLMMNYANDEEFPAIRKIGLNAGVTFAPVSLQAVVDNLASPSVVGGRLGLGIIPGMTELGVSSILDLDPMKDVSTAAVLANGQTGAPILITAGADLQLAKFDLGLVRSVLFADTGTFLPYYRSAMGTYSGFVMDTAFKDGTLKNFGITGGAYGNVSLLDYRLEVRFAKGIYTNTLFKADYNRTKVATMVQIQNYLKGGLPSADQATSLGIYGSAGFKLMELAAFEAGYLWPLTLTDGGVDSASDDHLLAKFEVFKDKLPFVPLSGSVSYERTKFAKTVSDLFNGGKKGLYLFDANTILKGELVYGLASTLDLVIGVSTNVVRDNAGNILYQADGLTPKIAPSINLETRVSF